MTFDDDDAEDRHKFSSQEILSEGPTSIVTRIESELPDGPRFIAIKTAADTKEPHDIVKEVRLLASLSHPNIISLIKRELGNSSLNLWMPYIPYSLDQVLESCRFSPHPIISLGSATSSSPTPREVQFVVLAKSIIFQILCGMSYLHGDHVQIAHRDVKPSNVLLTPTGCVQLIDFGIAFRVGEDRAAKRGDLWPEHAARMYFEVSTGPYRAPELLFGPRTYDAFAIDAWSLGATFAEFFTSLRLQTDDRDDEHGSFQISDHTSDSKSEAGSDVDAPVPPPTPFVIPRGTHTRPGMPSGRWLRVSLFDGTRGEIALAWSIFKIRGTPNADTWPSFLTLPDASKVSFVDVPAIDLAIHLPNLPPSTANASLHSSNGFMHAPCSDPVSTPLDLVHRFLVYEPSRRLRPMEALDHPWFRAEPGLVLPASSGQEVWTGDLAWVLEVGTVTRSFVIEGRTRTLGDLLRMHVTSKEH